MLLQGLCKLVQCVRGGGGGGEADNLQTIYIYILLVGSGGMPLPPKYRIVPSGNVHVCMLASLEA